MKRRGRRVVTPDGYVWYLRRRRARRRRPWSWPGRPPLARFHEEEELPAEEPPVPPWIDLWRVPNLEVGERGFDRFNNDRLAASNAVGAAVVGVFALSVVAWLTVEYVLPWLLPWLADNRRPVLWLIAAVAVAVGLNQLHRPWYVELQRQGLTDAAPEAVIADTWANSTGSPCASTTRPLIAPPWYRRRTTLSTV